MVMTSSDGRTAKLCPLSRDETLLLRSLYGKLFHSGVANMDSQDVLCSSQNVNDMVLYWTNLLPLNIGKHATLRERK